MDWFSAEFWSALFSIIVIDLVLAGDNAVVIGMAARNVPEHQQKRVIIWGTAGAIIIRAAATFVVVWLLKIPGLLLVGGAILFWIAYRLLTQKKDHSNLKAGDGIMGAIRTIIIADAVMGLDNVLAIAGAAHGSFVLVLIGLGISVPIIIWGSTLIMKWMERYPPIIYIGAGVLAFTAGKMITEEPLVHDWFAVPVWKWAFVAAGIAAVIVAGAAKNREVRPPARG